MTKKTTKGGGAKPLTITTVGSQISEADRKLFTEAELAALEAEVINEVSEEMMDEAKDRVRETLKAQKRLEMQRATQPDEEMCYIQVDVAPYADRIMLDNVVYLHGITYHVPRRIYDTMKEIISRTWEHETSRGNPNANYYLKPRSNRISPRDAGVDASALLMRV